MALEVLNRQVGVHAPALDAHVQAARVQHIASLVEHHRVHFVGVLLELLRQREALVHVVLPQYTVSARRVEPEVVEG